ncbi:carbon monoxide dehydrogenase subunit G [Herbihabitans rhizosphaerae]|uniref:Carbon monoxide dehydrogenase subunit G n=1 Tax=Herbihabitans rhizosphaerae TaxID=1872711 RepID=A0A4Q7KCF0_9PSEU|nr:SRPBCC family protein [Herbihabitans rhizosphaerae]RZS30336.1 carbon monoxide dehydrogenase subunit G [Herbihabitans rhizosphaerae]
MRLEHRFTVPAPAGEVWQAVTDPERVAPCMPGATLTGVDGSTFTGTVKVKLGPVSLQYKGSGEFVERDEQARRLVIKASGKDVRGAGTASATVTLTLSEQDGSTHGEVITDLAVTGRPARFGRGLISEVAGKLLDQFAGCLAGKLAPAEPKTVVSQAKQESQEDSVDLLELAGSPVAKRVAPVIAVVLALAIVVAVTRRRRS